MKIDNVALLIPTYPPHYSYVYNLLNNINTNQISIDVFLVFSTKEDYAVFSMKSDIKEIIVDQPITSRSIITVKKFFGLKQLEKMSYDYIICCDSETNIIPINFTRENINNKIKQIFDNKTIYAGKLRTTDGVRNISRLSASLFPSQYDSLRTCTDDFTLYFWWSDIPVYRRTDLSPFFNTINYDTIDGNYFDYIIYQYYLMIYCGFKVTNTTPYTGLEFSLEELNTNNLRVLNDLLQLHYGFGWITDKMYRLNREFITRQGGFLIYHLDRT